MRMTIITVMDVHDHVRIRLKLNPNETGNVTFSAKIERFIKTIGSKVKTANCEVEIRKMP